MCKVLDVSRGGYYDWTRRPAGPRQEGQEKIVKEIRKAHQTSRGVYGSPRVHRELKDQGVNCCENTVAKLMKQHDIRAKTAKRFKVKTTDSSHAHPIAPDRLKQDFRQALPDKVWTTDITYLATEEGWLYLAVVMDLCSRKIIGWSMAGHMEASLVMDALEAALNDRQPIEGLIVHSDRGVQYACDAYQALLGAKGLLCSMSRKGNCYDNAVTESFFKTLKTELVYHERYETREAARASVFEYIEVFYNRQRRHSSLGYLSPESFEATLN
jgi:transposase InsO family protein